MATYSQTILTTPGLVAYYRLGEASGTAVADETGGGRGLTNSGATVGATSLIALDANTAYSFDGTNDYCNNGSATAIDLATADQFSAEAWVRYTAFGSYGFWLGVSEGPLSGPDYRLGHQPGGGLYWNMSGAADRSDGGIVFSPDTTYHIVFTAGIETGTIHTRIYIDSVLVKTQDEGLAGLLNLGNIVIGADDGLSYTTHGVIDEVAIYNVVLTPEQIAAHYDIGLNGPPPSTGSKIIMPLGARRRRR